MKKYYFLILFFIPIVGFAQHTYHPDDKYMLRGFLRQNSIDPDVANLEKVGLTPADTLNWNYQENWVPKIENIRWNNNETKRLTEINWRNKGLAGNLDLYYCSYLHTVGCSDNSLVSLNISFCPSIMYISCEGNLLTSLDLSACKASLMSLDCARNQLSSLDVSDFTVLTELYCGVNQLSSMNLSGCGVLLVIYCQANQLTSLDLSDCVVLEELTCTSNKLSSVDLSQCTKLKRMFCGTNKLTSLDVSSCIDLNTLSCTDNSLSLSQLYEAGLMIDGTGIKTFGTQTFSYPDTDILTTGDVMDLSSETEFNGISTVFDVRRNTGSTLIDVHYTINNGSITFLSPGTYTISMTSTGIENSGNLPVKYIITDIQVTGEPISNYNEADKNTLRAFLRQDASDPNFTNCSFMGLAPADTMSWVTSDEWIIKVSGIGWNSDSPKRITDINWSSRELSGHLDLSGCPEIRNVNCVDNKLFSLNVSSASNLQTVYAENNTELSSLTLPPVAPDFNHLSCSNNNLTALNLSPYPNLKIVDCYANENLSTLTLSSNTALEELYCNKCKLTSLDLSSCILLKSLDCSENELTSINISPDATLNVLNCSQNNLPLTEVYELGLKIADVNGKLLGKQTCALYDDYTFITGTNIDFSNQSGIGGITTVYNVTWNGTPAQEGIHYLNIDGMIKVLYPGTYVIEMTNTAIESHSTYPVSYATNDIMVTGQIIGNSLPEVSGQENIYVYPNPVKRGEAVTVMLSQESVGSSLNIYSVNGSLMKAAIPLLQELNIVDVSGFSSGIYLFTVTNQSGIKQTFNVIVE